MPHVHHSSTGDGAWAGARRRAVLVGRRDACRDLDEMTAAARSGRGGSLVIRAEAGMGKSALLDRAAGGAAGFQVIRASGSEFEQELAYSALHQLCLPLLGRLPELPERHQEALRVAFGLAPGAPDPFQIGLATLGLAAAAAQERPLLCLVDDAQWLDSASSKAMLFLARRIAADPVVLLFAARTAEVTDELDELRQLDVPGLSDEEAVLLLESRSPFPLDDQVRNRLIAEAHGNPLALLELPRAGGYVPPETASVPTRIERGFESRLVGLSGGARLLLTLASADPTGDPGLLWRAARRLNLDRSRSVAEATATGLAEFGTRVRFCHPLARSAVYRAARAEERQAAHHALAEATDRVEAPDRRAWHLAQAGPGPDDEIAAELERCAARARARGGAAAAAAFLERSAALSLDGARRVERTLVAAESHLEAGTIEAATRLLSTTETATLAESQRTVVEILRGRIAFLRHDGLTGSRLMVSAARRLTTTDPGSAREVFVDALEMSLAVGHSSGAIAEVLRVARTTAPAASSPDVLEALLALAARDYHVAVPMLRTILHDGGEPFWSRRPALATTIAAELWDTVLYAGIAEVLMAAGRKSGSPSLLGFGLAQKAVDAAMNGDVARAVSLTAEEAAVADAAGTVPLFHHRLYLAAIRGRRQEALDIFEAAATRASSAGTGRNAVLHWAAAVLHNGLADHPSALSAALRAVEDNDLFLTGVALPELIEAAVRCRQPAVAARALASLTDSTRATGTAMGLGIAASARGLVTGAESHHREAVELLGDGPPAIQLGRARLLYGEWLRGTGRRQDARDQLRLAHELLVTAGAEGFARRAAAGLHAIGDRVGTAAVHPLNELSMQETAVARAVATGATSHEVALQLFISKRTVDAHLRAIFRKLGVSSRRQLRTCPELLG